VASCLPPRAEPVPVLDRRIEREKGWNTTHDAGKPERDCVAVHVKDVWSKCAQLRHQGSSRSHGLSCVPPNRLGIKIEGRKKRQVVRKEQGRSPHRRETHEAGLDVIDPLEACPYCGLEGHVTHHAGPEVALVEEENLQGRCRARRTSGSLPRGRGGSAAADRGDGAVRSNPGIQPPGDKTSGAASLGSANCRRRRDAAAWSFHRAGPLVPHSRDYRRRRLATEQPAQEFVYEVSHVSGRFALYAARTPNWISHF
jgi:hypothetical protein